MVNFLLYLSGGVAFVFIAFTGFVKFATYECKSFSIDDQSGKVVLITGANSGIGLYTSLYLAKHGAKIIMGCRSLLKCEEAKARILLDAPKAAVDTIALDLASFTSIKKFASTVRKQYPSVDVLVNNAGIMALPTRELTADGLEAQIGTNHFGHFLLTSELLPILSQNGKIVNHASSAHMMAQTSFPFADLQCNTTYDPWSAYGNSKLANLYFTFELNKRLHASGNKKNLTSIAVHPGYTDTNLQTGAVKKYGNAFFATPVEDGSLSQIGGSHETLTSYAYFHSLWCYCNFSDLLNCFLSCSCREPSSRPQ